MKTSFLFSQDSLLSELDIPKIMDDLFKQHVDKKEISPTLFKQTSQRFVEQFDPDKIYLLDKEAQPFLDLSDKEAQRILDAYKRQDYDFFAELNKLFEKAVIRSKKVRVSQRTQYRSWIQQVAKEGGRFQSSWANWATSPDELSERQEEVFKAFVANAVHRYGKARILQNQSEIISQYEEDREKDENPYLFRDAKGINLSDSEKHNLFSLRVLKAMAASLDAHTRIYNPKEASEVKTRLEKGGEVKVTSEKFGNGVIGIIKLDSFFQSPGGSSSETAVKDAIKKLDKENLRGLILDLRENSGGFLNQAVKVAGLFITNGIVVISKYSSGDEKFYRDLDGKTSYNGPLVILVSKMTASAAEIVAGALQDYGVALIVGDDHTYGKGTIQSQTITEDKKEASYFKVTVGMYYTPSGSTPQIKGVRSDIVVPGVRENQKIGEAYLDNSISQGTIPSAINDKLEGVDLSQKDWYIKYYLPSLQKQKTSFQKILPELQAKSAYRIANSLDYQAFIKNRDQNQQQDLQLNEAVEVVKDIIYIETKSRLKPNPY